EFRSDVGFEGKIEEVSSKKVLEDQLSKFICAMKRRDGGEYHASSVRSCLAAIWRYLNQHSVMEKPVDILNPKVYFDLNQVINRKLKNLSAKGFGEKTGADGLTMNEDYDAQAEVISLPNIKDIIDDYEFYLSKRPVTAVTNFYLKPFTTNSVQFNGQWYYGRAFGERTLRGYLRTICETVGIQIGTRNISNHSGRKTAVQLLKELGYSDSVVMSITRHKSQKGLAAYERPKSVMQREGINGFFNALMQVSNKALEDDASEASVDAIPKATVNVARKENITPKESVAPKKNIVPDKSGAPKENGIFKDFIPASLYVQRADSQASLVNAFDDLDVSSQNCVSCTALVECSHNILESDTQKETGTNAEKDEKKLQNKEFIEKFMTGNTFYNCIFNF
ncbi:13153_t:CDS:2, partial [Cetraspora pellucida]